MLLIGKNVNEYSDIRIFAFHSNIRIRIFAFFFMFFPMCSIRLLSFQMMIYAPAS